MYYTINRTDLRDRIDEEVSHVADQAYGDNGASLYDSIVLTEKDDDMVGRFIDTAIYAITTRMFDICKHYYTTESSQNQTLEQLQFYVPDFDETMEQAVKDELTNFIVLFICHSIFQMRRASVLPQYADMVQASLNKAVTLLKSRKSPIKIW